MKAGAWWPIAIVGVLGVTVAANIALMVAARDPNAYVVEKDYYRRAVAWDSTMAEARRSAALGWQADAAFGAWGHEGTPVTVALADSTRAPLDGAVVQAELVNNLEPEHVVGLRFSGVGGGHYTAVAPLARPGMWELRLAATRGRDRYVTDLRRDAVGGRRAVIALAGSVLLASLLGSPHCAGMCGGFVVFYAGQDGGRRWPAHLAYNLGRLLSYVALGALAGVLGQALDRAGAGSGFERPAAIAAGAVMLVWGAAALLVALGVRLPMAAAPAFLHSRFAAALRRVHAQPPAVRAAAVGLVTTLLPCGWLWVYVATAAGTGSLPTALLVMTAFWFGTLPMMAGLGLAAQRAIDPLRRRLPVFTAATLMVLGLLTLGGKFRAAAPGGHCAKCAPPTSHVGH